MPLPNHPDSCARNPQSDVAPQRVAQKTGNLPLALHLVSKTFALLPPAYLLLLTLNKTSLLALLELERLVFCTGKLQRQRHGVAVDRSGECRRLGFRLLVCTDRSAALHRVRPAQIKPPVSIHRKRTFDRSMRAIVLNRRRLRSVLDIDVVATPNSGRNSLHISRARTR